MKNTLLKIIQITFYSLIFEDVLRSPPFNVA
jgi:hypothetical protein